MEIYEINSIQTDNTATLSLTTDNTATSDEIKPNYDYVSKGKTEYAKNKATKVTTAAAIITVSFLSGGTLLTNTFLGDLPTIEEVPQFVYEENTFSYSFHLENKGSIKAGVLITYQMETIYEKDVSETGDYQDTITLEFDKLYDFKVQITNRFDFKRYIVEEEIKLTADITQEETL